MSTETPWPTPLPSPHPDENPQRSTLPLWPALRADAIAFAVVGGAGLLAAFPVGALWRWTAPAVLGVVSQGLVYFVAPETKTFIARDGWFALFAVIAAILLAVFAFLRYRRRAGVGAALGLAAGGIAGGYLAAWFGARIGPGGGSITRAAQAAGDANFDLPLAVRAVGVIWLWPAVAAGLFFFLILLFGPSDPESEPEPFPGWGEYAAPTGQTSPNGSAAHPSGDAQDGHSDPPTTSAP